MSDYSLHEMKTVHYIEVPFCCLILLTTVYLTFQIDHLRDDLPGKCVFYGSGMLTNSTKIVIDERSNYLQFQFSDWQSCVACSLLELTSYLAFAVIFIHGFAMWIEIAQM